MFTSRFVVSVAMTLVLASAVACGVQGSGIPAEEKRTVPLFDGLWATSAGSVILTVEPGTADATTIELTVSGDDNLVPEVETTVVDGVLEVHARGGQDLDPELPLRVVAVVPELYTVEAAETADVTVRGIDNEAFVLQAGGSADVSLSGTTSALIVEASGSADVSARQLEAMTVEVASGESADVKVCADDEITVSASGSSDVTYFCAPTTVQKRVIDSADVRAGV